MKPNPLAANPKLLDRVEHALQWVICWAIIYWPDRPLLSGLVTAALLAIPMFLGRNLDFDLTPDRTLETVTLKCPST